MSIITQNCGITSTGKPIIEYVLTNQNGMEAHILNLGGVIRKLLVRDQDNNLVDVVLGYELCSSYESDATYFGCLVGRYANRIINSTFTLNGTTYQLKANDNKNHLHGPWSFRIWDSMIENEDLVLKLYSPAEEEGYPGNVNVTVRYKLTEDNALMISYDADTDEDTVINLTNHSYFNLSGEHSGDVLQHYVQMYASKYAEGNEEVCPTGCILSVDGTPMDFRTVKKIGKDINADYPNLKYANGYDHNFIIDAGEKVACRVWSEQSGICMEVETTQPAFQFYTGNQLDDRAPNGKAGKPYCKHAGFALETQHYPASPNFEQFPSTVLRKEEHYHEETKYLFFTI